MGVVHSPAIVQPRQTGQTYNGERIQVCMKRTYRSVWPKSDLKRRENTGVQKGGNIGPDGSRRFVHSRVVASHSISSRPLFHVPPMYLSAIYTHVVPRMLSPTAIYAPVVPRMLSPTALIPRCPRLSAISVTYLDEVLPPMPWTRRQIGEPGAAPAHDRLCGGWIFIEDKRANRRMAREGKHMLKGKYRRTLGWEGSASISRGKRTKVVHTAVSK